MVRFICSGFLFIFLLLIKSYSIHAEKTWVEQGDLSKKWYVYSPNWKTFLPYVATKHFSYQSKSLIFDTHQKTGTFLKIVPKENYHLFLNGVYQWEFKSGKTYQIQIDSLLERYQADKFLVFTIYHRQLRGLPLEVTQTYQTSAVVSEKEGLFSVLSRPSAVLDNFFFVGTLLIIFLFALIYRYFPRNFSFFFRFADWLSFTYKEDPVVKTIFSFPNIIMLICLSLLTGYIAFYHSFIDPLESDVLTLGGNDMKWWDAVVFIFQKSGLAFILFLGRYLAYLIFTNLFKMEMLATPHFLKSIQTNIQFFTVLFFILFLMYLLGGPSLHPSIELLSWAVNVYFLIRMIYFFFLFKKTFHINSVTLFAYLLFMEGQIVVFGIRQLIFPTYI